MSRLFSALIVTLTPSLAFTHSGHGHIELYQHGRIFFYIHQNIRE